MEERTGGDSVYSNPIFLNVICTLKLFLEEIKPISASVFSMDFLFDLKTFFVPKKIFFNF